MSTLKTTEMARKLGIPPYLIHGWQRQGLLHVPAKDASGHLLWADADVAAARQLAEQRGAIKRPSDSTTAQKPE